MNMFNGLGKHMEIVHVCVAAYRLISYIHILLVCSIIVI